MGASVTARRPARGWVGQTNRGPTRTAPAGDPRRGTACHFGLGGRARPRHPETSPELLVTMLSCAMAEALPLNMALTAHNLAWTPIHRGAHDRRAGGFSVAGYRRRGVRVVRRLLFGSGPGSIGCAEKSATIGGTWRENRIGAPGVGPPPITLSFSFAPHDWSSTSRC